MDIKKVPCTRCVNYLGAFRDGVCSGCENTRFIDDPASHICNMCGERTRPLGTMNEQYPSGLEYAEVAGGYDSTHLLDGHSYKFSLCELCLRKMFNQFKIPPVINDYMMQEANPQWSDDQKSYEHAQWISSGGQKEKYKTNICNANKDCSNASKYSIYNDNQLTEYCLCEDHKDEYQYYHGYVLGKFVPFKMRNFL